ncbi:MAG: sigma-54-dependent transcriptional regulator [Acidobacteriota bacterium]
MIAEGRLLVVEDDPVMRSLLAKILTREGHEVQEAPDGRSAIRYIEEGRYDVVLADLKIPNPDGLEVLRAVKQKSPATEVIVMTAFGSVETAVAAMKQGAYDYISKPFNMEEIQLLVQKALEKGGLRREVEKLREEVRGTRGLQAIIGRGPAMKRVFDVIRSVAPSNSTVLITGRSGTGKELVARAIHDNSPRRNKGFVVIHCGAIPDALLESELFGYRKGAFTGAVRDHKGLFEQADKGTVFLDEVNTLTPATQAKLLRVLEDKCVRQLGSGECQPVDVRLLAASNQDLGEEVRRGRFREDLYYRLNVVHIHLPDLKERPEDIPLLTEHFLGKFCRENGRPVRKLSRETADLLISYAWPGNVRELKNMMEQAVLLAPDEVIRPEDLPELGSHWQEELGRRLSGEGASLEGMERCYIEETLRRTGGNKGRAARVLGIDRRTLYSKMRKYGIGEPS